MIAWPWGHCMGVVPGPGLIYLMVINGCLWSWECLCVNKGLGWSLGWLCVVSGTRPGGWGQNCPVKGTNKTNVYYHPHQSVGIAAGANQYEPPVAAGPPTLFYAGASCFSAFPAPREVAGPLLWEKGSCQMGPQRRVGKNTFMGPLYKELMHEAEPWGLRRGRTSTSPQLPQGPPPPPPLLLIWKKTSEKNVEWQEAPA